LPFAKTIDVADVAVSPSVITGKGPIIAEDDDTAKSVRFIKPVPKFLGPELETYGPFEEQDIASLPSKVANILIRKERAEEIKAN